jgi:CubicO group peptidase (beta-lactamase class C family)
MSALVRTQALVAGLAAGLLAVTPAVAATPSAKSQIDTAIRAAMPGLGARATIVQVTRHGRPVITKAYGESMPGVPATTRMRFRNGSVAISYMSTLLLRLVDQGKVRLDDPVSKWLPDLRDGNRVTLRMLAAMTAGYHDYELDPAFVDQLYTDPFKPVTTARQLELMLSRPLMFTPGTNWSYSHSDYVVLGLALEKITGTGLDAALRKHVLRPLGLRHTVASQTAAIPAPALHTYSAERRDALGIPAKTPFLEDSTHWNPAWTLARGAVQTTDITDLTRTAIGIGSGRLLSRASYRRQINANIGFGRAQEGCEACGTMTRRYGFGLGVIRKGGWILQTPLFAGQSIVEAYLPSKRISIAIVTTMNENGFDAEGAPVKAARELFARIGAIVAPGDPPPV